MVDTQSATQYGREAREGNSPIVERTVVRRTLAGVADAPHGHGRSAVNGSYGNSMDHLSSSTHEAQ